MASSASVTGDEITYSPLAHFPRSMMRQRSLQKGNSASVFFTAFLQVGQLSLRVRLRGIRFHYCRRKRGSESKIALNDLGHQIVVVGFGDLAAVELAGLRLVVFEEVVDEDFAIDFRGVHGSAAFEQ